MKPYMTVKEVSALTGLGVGTLNKWRCEGKGPEYFRLGRRVLYGSEKLQAFLNQNTHLSTAEYLIADQAGSRSPQPGEPDDGSDKETARPPAPSAMAN
jgi:hypothetical protein